MACTPESISRCTYVCPRVPELVGFRYWKRTSEVVPSPPLVMVFGTDAFA